MAPKSAINLGANQGGPTVTMIPRCIHSIWVGSPLPAKQRAFIDTWKETNPHFEFMHWDESNIDFTVPKIKDAYARKRWSTVADIARLSAVYRHGGIYLDTDF